MSNLVKYNSGLSKVDASIKVANKLLDVNNELPELIPYRKGDKWGYCDRFKKIIIPCIYDKVGYFTFDVAIVVLNNKYGLIDKIGKTILPFIYDDITRFTNISGTSYLKFLKIKIDNKYGVSNLKGSVIYECKYEEIAISVFTVEHIKILFYKNNDTYSVGLFDYNGNEIVSNIYADIVCPSEGISAVKSNINKNWGFIDLNGNQITPFIYEDDQYKDLDGDNINLYIFKNGILRVKLDDKYGVINKKGNYIIPCIFESLEIVDNVIFASTKKHSNYDCIFNSEGKILTPQNKYKSIEFHSNEILIAKTYENKYGIIDCNGNIKLDFSFDYLKLYDENLILVKSNFKHGIINLRGDVLVPIKYDNIEVIIEANSDEYNLTYTHEYVYAMNENMWGVLDLNGNEIIPIMYKRIEPYYGKGHDVQSFENDLWAIFLNNGTQFTPFCYSYSNFKMAVCSTSNKHIGVCQNNKYGIIDLSGNIVIECIYDSIYYRDSNYNYYEVEKKIEKSIYSQKGIFDKNGKIILNCIYHYIEFSFNYFITTLNKKSSIYNKKGQLKVLGEFDSIVKLLNGLIKTTQNDIQCIYETNHGQLLFYDIKDTLNFTDNLVCIKNQANKWGIIDKNGMVVLPFIYDKFEEHKFDKIKFMFILNNNKWGVIDENCNFVISCKFEDILLECDMSYFMKNDEKWVYVDKNGKQIVNILYDDIIHGYHRDLCKISINGKVGYIDKKGTQYWED